MADDRDYKVGYRKPPLHTRFQPGRSGNGKGRPKRRPPDDESFEEMFRRLTRSSVRVNVQGKQIEIRKIDAIFEQLINLAARGNLAAIREFVKLVPHAQGPARQPQPTVEDQTESDEAIIDRFLRRHRGAAGDLGEDGEDV